MLTCFHIYTAKEDKNLIIIIASINPVLKVRLCHPNQRLDLL